MKKLMVAVAGAVLMAGMANAHAADLEAGKAKYMACQGCHGPTGAGQAIFPAVAGKDVDYLIEVMTKYRDGETVGANTALMAPHARALSDEDIANLSAYMNSL